MNKANLWPALWEGFRLIGREPLSVLVWGVAYLVVMLAVQALSFMVLGGEMFAFYGELAKSMQEGGEPSGAGPPSPGGGLYALTQLLQLVVGIFAPAVIYSAIFRAVLFPEQRRNFYLRFGADELRIALVFLVFGILFAIIFVVLAIILGIPLVIALIAAESSGGSGAGVGIGVLLAVLVLMVVSVIAYTRLGMAMPMTIAEGRIRIFEAWSFTKGYTGSLAVLAVMQILIGAAAYIAIIFAVIGVGAAGAVGAASQRLPLDDPQAMFAALTGVFLPAVLVGGVLYLIVSVVGMPILMAPWARVQKLIADARDGDDPAVFD